MANLIFCLHLFATLFMVGVIWMVQLVHYPLFDHVGRQEFCRYEAQHCRRISWIVMPVMLIELATALLLGWWLPSPLLPKSLAWVGIGFLIAIWISTSQLSVPCHKRLSQEFTVEAHRRLVLTNWIRTILWTSRGLLLIYGLWQALQSPLFP